jgi:hypothetical protein
VCVVEARSGSSEWWWRRERARLCTRAWSGALPLTLRLTWSAAAGVAADFESPDSPGFVAVGVAGVPVGSFSALQVGIAVEGGHDALGDGRGGAAGVASCNLPQGQGVAAATTSSVEI